MATNPNTNQNNQNDKPETCRRFLKGKCKKERFCKYYHPSKEQQSQQPQQYFKQQAIYNAEQADAYVYDYDYDDDYDSNHQDSTPSEKDQLLVIGQ